MALQRTELERTVALLESLSPDEWAAQTECPAWDVRRMYLHVLGACEGAASMKEQMHQMRAARTHQKAEGGPLEAGLSAVQVRERESLTTAELVERLRAIAPRTIKKRSSLPGFVRNGVRMKVDGPVVERWKLGYLVDTIYLRDMWMHRVDACRATGRTDRADAEHDGRIVADVARVGLPPWPPVHARAHRPVAVATWSVGEGGRRCCSMRSSSAAPSAAA
jgi:uncharacterized protein (TIGR03083 family)